jgi:hypothetical protein
MKIRFTLFAVAVLFLLMSSCKKDDPTLQAQLEGEWDVESFTEDGTEIMGSLYQVFTMDFGDYEGNEGDARWTITYFDGSTEVSNGFYTVNEENETVRLEFDGEVTRLDIDEIDGDELVLSGVVDGFNYEIKAEKR